MGCKHITIALFAVTALVGCSLEEPPEGGDAPIEAYGGPVDVDVAGLQLSEQSEDRLAGSLRIGETIVSFDVRQIAHQRFDIEIRHGDRALTAASDYAEKSFVLGGHKSDGAELRLDKRDLYAVTQLGHAITEAELPDAYRPDVENMRGVVYHTTGSALRRALAVWATSNAGDIATRTVKGNGVISLCAYLTDRYVPASHDCYFCDHDDWNLVEIGPGGPINCYPDSCNPACTNYNSGTCSANACVRYNGGISVVQWGSDSDKYGACSLFGGNRYTVDCLNLGHCHRNGHSDGSHWCSDESDAASDDQLQAPNCIMNNGCSNTCGGYSVPGECWCDESCEGLGDCCMDKKSQCG